MKKVIDTGKRSTMLGWSEASWKHQNLESFLERNFMQKEILLLHKPQDYAYE